MTSYPQETQQIMRKFYNTLSEKDKRRYAATEAIKFGHGGVSIIAEILGCARSTIHFGIAELKSLPTDCGYDPAIRIAGGGRKPYDQTRPDIDSAFLAVVENHTASSQRAPSIEYKDLVPLKCRLTAKI